MSPKPLEDVRTGDGLTLASLTIGQYHQMIRNGILAEDEPIELIRGVLAYKDRRDTSNGVNTPSEFRKKIQGVRHSSVVNQLGEILTLTCVPLGCHRVSNFPCHFLRLTNQNPIYALFEG